jgi:ABC-type polysaccharide/polyol phosphate transport system ATPase subunit|tara:strand:- start:340 stop:1059 length:720 start_codon:yes stop_codon:yes gene_type:complete
MSQNAIEVKNVTLHFPKQRNALVMLLDALKGNKRRFTALKNISLDVKRGEIVGIIGRNGCGKSTLLRVMAGIYPPDEGQTYVAGDISLLAGLGTGFSPHQTGRENAILYGSILGHDEEDMNSKLPEIIEFSELGAFIDEPIRTYSAGMKARLGLAVASAINPDILLIDEVLGVGDPQFREKSKKKILNMVEGAGTVVIVSHSFGLMKSICDRLILIHEGKIVIDGEPSEAIEKYYELTE